MMFGAYFVIAIVIGHLATQLREREQSERRREERATALYRLTRALAASRDLDEALPKVLALIKESFQADAAVWLRDENGLSRHWASTFAPSSKDESVAVWAFQKKQAAGKSTDTLAGCRIAACAARDRRSRRRRAHCPPSESAYARATRIARRLCRAARAVREQGARARRKPCGANFPPIREDYRKRFSIPSHMN